MVEYYPKEESLPAMIEEYVPHDQRHDDFYERSLEQRTGKMNSFTEPLAADAHSISNQTITYGSDSLFTQTW